MNKYFKKISELDEKIKNKELQKSKLEKLKQKTIELATAEINAEYDKLCKPYTMEIEKSKDEINRLMLEYGNHFIFPAALIGEAMADVVTTFEGEKYIYQETTFKTKKTIHSVMDRMEVPVIKNIRVIINESEAMHNYEDFNFCFNQIRDAGELIVLDSNEEEFEPELLLKDPCFSQEEENHVIRYGNFTYIKNYVDFLVTKRIENKTKNINEQELKKSTREFYQLNQQEILKKYEKKKLLLKEEQNEELIKFEDEQIKKLTKKL